ncbi:MAG TPA: hypothetical protein VHT97_03540 [Acidimicrobiales bacterium]|nr:hypothetical protein [Acidimicrobiales bacterium]
MRFLSSEWLERLAAAVAAAPPPGTPAVSIHQRVTGGPDGDVEYTLRLGNGAATVEPGPGAADVEVVQDYATAAAISRGVLSPAAAFAAGRLHLVGPVSSLVANQEAVAALGPALAGLAEGTTY